MEVHHAVLGVPAVDLRSFEVLPEGLDGREHALGHDGAGGGVAVRLQLPFTAWALWKALPHLFDFAATCMRGFRKQLDELLDKLKDALKKQGDQQKPIDSAGNPVDPDDIPDNIYRGGKKSPSNLKPDEDGNVSFRDSVSNPAEGDPVMKPGKPFMETDTSKLPPGSATRDGGLPDGRGGTNPPGHVSVKADKPTIQDASKNKTYKKHLGD